MDATPPARRKSTRLRGFDYSAPNCYFATLCTAMRRLALGRVRETEVDLSPAGRIVERTWCDLPGFYRNDDIDNFIVMPNHVHGMLVLTEVRRDDAYPDRRPRSLSEVIRGFKSMSARAIGRSAAPGKPFWQRGFCEHIVRSETDLERICEYIDNNPIAWANDPENPERAIVGWGQGGSGTRPY
ncbi:MAG TPA: transposase [Alphaproteobacteria bacterium]|jgi:REP element-mobilizing transposase RayT